MENKKKFLFGLLLIISLVVVSAYILDMHVKINDTALQQTASSPITQRILPYKDYYDMGVQIPDISVVTYFDKSCQDATGFSKLTCLLTFNIGKPYLASHSKSTCLRAIDLSNQEPDPVMREKAYAVAMGWCSHIIQDADSHNHFVNLAIQRSFLFNGLIHSPAEIWLKNEVTNEQDRVRTRQVLGLSYEMTPFVQKVLIQDPSFSSVNIPSLIDFFTKQVQQSTEYQLGFKSFFAIPSYILWLMAIGFLISLTLLAVVIRKIRNGDFSIALAFIGVLSLVILITVGLMIYGVFTATVWSLWESLSQILFSAWMYLVIGVMLFIAVVVIYDFIKKPNKKQNIPNLLVGIVLILIAIPLFSMPTSLQAVDPQTQFDLSVAHTKALLTQGSSYVLSIEDPSGFTSLKNADESNTGIRTVFMITIVALFLAISYFAFRRKK